MFFSPFKTLSLNLAMKLGVLCQGPVAPRSKRPLTLL